MKRLTYLVLLGISLISLSLSLIRFGSVPQCFNADEAAFGYNAYSILKTGRDEYGAFMPLRLKSFGDYKMPLYTYGSIPFVALMGLTESSARALNVTISFFLPIAVFLLARELFKKDTAALLASFLVSTSLALHIVGRHAHEAYLTVFLITLASYFFLRVLKKKNTKTIAAFFITIGLSLVGYQSSRLFAGFFFLMSLYFLWKKKLTKLFVIIFFLLLVGSAALDVVYKPDRVSNLVFWNNPGFELSINEKRGEGGSRLVYNKLTMGAYVFATRYLEHLSPAFLIEARNVNPRFGTPSMPYISIIEYVTLFAGIFMLFKKRHPFAWYITLLFFLSPLPSVLSWDKPSITRSLFFFIPALVISAYGMYGLATFSKKSLWRTGILLLLIASNGVLLFFSWNFYLSEYTKKPEVTREWQCGYRELAAYVKQKYDTTDRFYISRANGQPYMFMLFYLTYPPERYQPQAFLTGPDEYGFGQVEKFGKFIFSFPKEPYLTSRPRAVLIGSPEEFADSGLNTDKTRKINVNGSDMFWIYEP